MIGIEDIAIYLPQERANNLELQEHFSIDEDFIRQKIGVVQRAQKASNEDTSDLALKALEELLVQTGLKASDIEVLVVVTQNPDSNLPHVSAVVHGRANLPDSCAAFDISLGCSGYVYGLSILQNFIVGNGLTRGVLITADPYSKIINPEDKNTVLLFGDAATATLLGPDPKLTATSFTFGTRGSQSEALVCRDGVLSMNGRDVFNFAAVKVPLEIKGLLDKANIDIDEIDRFYLHQGSRYIVETIAKRLGLPRDKVPVDIDDYGNTVSSSIPILLEREIRDVSIKRAILCGFGVGLSWGSCLLRRTGE